MRRVCRCGACAWKEQNAQRAKHTIKVLKRAASPADVQPCVTVAGVARP